MTQKRRLQIQLDESLYDRLRRRAFERQRSMAAMVREAVVDSLTPSGSRRDPRDYPLTGLVGIANSGPLPDGRAVSEHHDEVLAEAYAEGWHPGDELAEASDPDEGGDRHGRLDPGAK